MDTFRGVCMLGPRSIGSRKPTRWTNVAVDFATKEVDLGAHGDESGPFQAVNGKKSGGPGDGETGLVGVRVGWSEDREPIPGSVEDKVDPEVKEEIGESDGGSGGEELWEGEEESEGLRHRREDWVVPSRDSSQTLQSDVVWQ